MSPAQVDAARSEILRLARTFADIPPPQQDWSGFDAFIAKLVAEGLDRGDLYRLVLDVALEHRESLAAESFDALDGYMSGLTGHCAMECWPRFPGEPTNDREFAEYVRGHKWMKQ